MSFVTVCNNVAHDTQLVMIIITKKRGNCNSFLDFYDNGISFIMPVKENVKKEITIAHIYCKIDKKHI